MTRAQAAPLTPGETLPSPLELTLTARLDHVGRTHAIFLDEVGYCLRLPLSAEQAAQLTPEREYRLKIEIVPEPRT